MTPETDAQFLERMRRRRGFPTRDDIVRMDRIRREGGGGNVQRDATKDEPPR